MKKIKLHWQILIAFVLAVLYGIFLKDYVHYVSWMGDLCLRALMMVIVPLILSSIISGMTNIGSGENLGRIGLKTMLYYLSTSIFAILTGLVLVNLIQPGVGADLGFAKEVEGLAEARESFGETLLYIIPKNIFESFSQGNMLSVIFFAIIFGFFITRVPDKHRIFLTDLANSVFEVMMKLTMFVIRFAPLLVFGIVAQKVAEIPDLVDTFLRLLTYMLAVLMGLLLHSTITLPLIVKVIGRVSPLKHFKAMSTPLLTAFSTSSSNATLPLTMEAVENNSGVSNKITSFTLPLGATVNMDGTALYECVAAMFIAQAYGVELSFIQQIVVVFTALLASIGAAGIPMAGLVMMTVILSSVGLPLEGVGLILAVDRILDMCRTTVNVWSDSCGAVVIARTEGEKLKIE
ncbi:MAG: dicarboxylate/amino acid:cation symporter [Ignavibacteriales bacterium]|nr:dicarboxylate/amino acid:cation symporter [Ignavibacteriales bacterium]